jgi:hypothetical protein
MRCAAAASAFAAFLLATPTFSTAGVYEDNAKQTQTTPDKVFNGCGNSCGSCESACGSCCWQPSNYCYVDALYLKRDTPDRSITVWDFSPASVTGTSVLSGKNLHFDPEGALRILVGRQLSPCAAVEFSFMGFHDANTGASIFHQNEGLDAVGLTPFDDFNNGRAQQARYSSELQNWELNLRRGNPCDNFSVIFGLRYMNVEEDYQLMSIDDAGASDIGIYDVKTRNYMFGPQIGGTWKSNTGKRFNYGVNGKVGVLFNSYDVNSRVINNSIEAFKRQENEEGWSSVVEVGFFGNMRVTDNWGIRGGYEFLMINGAALAIDQLPGTTNVGSSIYHGPFVGIEGRR